MTTNKGGRPSPWQSSSQTQLIRVPIWMVEEILTLAKIKDANPDTSFVQYKQKSSNSFVQNQVGSNKEEIRALIDRYKTQAKDTRDWTKAKMIIGELETILEEK